jgi:uncharacterized coiled-coil protein SlyX
MAAIFQLRRGSGSVSLVDGELYVNKGIESLQYAVEEKTITLAKLNEPNTGSLKLYGDITASNLYVTGNVNIEGKITIGDNQTGDTLNIVASLSSSLIPNNHKAFDIGSDSKWYKNLYVETISASFISGAIAGIGSLEVFSQSVDSRLDYLEGPFSTSVDSRMDLLENVMSGSNRLYVSPEGNDTNNGTQQNPFKTIKAAVESLGNATAGNVKRYTIFVGSGNYTENNPIAVPPGVAIVGDTLRTVRLTASSSTKDFFHVHDSNYFYGLRFLNLQNPAFCFSFPCSTANATISGGGVSAITMVHTESGYANGENVNVIIEKPNADAGVAATATATVSGGVLSISIDTNGSGYVAGEKPHISIQAPTTKRPIIGTSPYVQNCSSIAGPFTTDGTLLSLVPGNVNYAPLPYNVNDVRNASNNVIGSGIIDEQGAGGGIRIDGNLVSGISPLESFVADAFTQVNQGGPGHLVINKGYAQFVSCFTTFCTYGFKTANGGFANISNSVIDFGKEGLVSKTYFPTTYNTGSALETKTSQVSGFIIDENGAGYVGPTAGVTITGGGASVQATAEATVNANGSIDEIVLLTGGSGYTTPPSVTIDPPTGPGAIQATTVAGKALISGVSEMLMALESGSRGIDISSNMILNGVDYLVTDVAAVSGQSNQRRVTTYPAPPSIATNAQIKFHQLSNISTGGLVMEYVGSGVTYNALPKYGGVPIRTREIVEYAPGRVFYSTVDNIGNLKIGDFFSVNQLTGEVTIDANSFNLSGLNAIGPFKRNGVAVGVVLQEVSNNTTLLNSQGLFGEDTVPTQYAVKEYVQEINTSLDGRLDKLEQTSGSLNTFSGSALIRLSNLETTSGSHIIRLNNLESKSASVDVSLAEIHTYTSSLKTAIGVSGTDVTVLGNLTVNGTTTQINSTQVNIGDNILELNFGGSATEAGIYTKDGTGLSNVSGSLLWDSTNDYWKAGKKDLESKILLAGGDGVLSGSTDFNAFSTSVDSRLTHLQTKSASVDISIANINSTTASLNTSISNLNGATASLYTSASLMTASIASLTASVSALQAFSGNVNVRFDNLQTYTTSVDSRFSTLGNYTGSVENRFTTLGNLTSSILIWTGSVNDRLTNLESKSASVDTSITNINTFTQSVNDRFTTLAIYTGSINSDLTSIHQTTSSLNQFSASISTSVSTSLASIVDHEDRITYVEGLNGITGGNPLIPLNQFSASAKISIANLESFTSSIDTTIKNKLNLDNVVSGSTQLIGLLPSGVVSGSSQVNIYDLENFATFNDAISDDINGKEEIASATHTLVSGSSQVTSLLPNGVVSSSLQISSLFEEIASSTHTLVSGSSQVLGGSGVWSGSAQMPVGVVSGSLQVLGGSGVWSSSVQMPVGVVSGSSQILGGSTIHSGSVGDYQFNSIGVGTAASTTTGEIRALGDITAYYSSDIRLKENIIPIENALSKVESISGNTYDWKEGFDEIHSHKGNDVGVIAQEIEEILPQIVTNRDNGYKAVQYEKIIPLLIEAIKELSSKVDRLENK